MWADRRFKFTPELLSGVLVRVFSNLKDWIRGAAGLLHSWSSHTAAAELFSFCHIELTLGLWVDLCSLTWLKFPEFLAQTKLSPFKYHHCQFEKFIQCDCNLLIYVYIYYLKYYYIWKNCWKIHIKCYFKRKRITTFANITFQNKVSSLLNLLTLTYYLFVITRMYLFFNYE